MNFQFKKNEIIILLFHVLLLIWGAYYYFVLIYNLIDGYILLIAGYSFCLIVLNMVRLFYSKNLTYLVFIICIIVFNGWLGKIKGKDIERLNLIFLEVSSKGSPFPKQIELESLKNNLPKYYYWLYQSNNENSFDIYYLNSSNLYRRSYPFDEGWVYVQTDWRNWKWINNKSRSVK